MPNTPKRGEIEMKAHSYGETWKYDATNHWKECDVCSNKTEIAAHDLGEWTVVTEATYQAEGSKERACKTCDYKENAKIDKLVAVTSIAINGEQTLWLKINETATLETTVLPENATDKTIEWTSSAPDVVEVARGRVLAHATGSATITATAKDGQGASASVTINVIVEAESIDLQGKKYITVGGTIEFTATVAPDNTTDKTVTWTTDNNDVATINEQGTLTAVKEGQVTVTATTSNGKTATATVYVTKVANRRRCRRYVRQYSCVPQRHHKVQDSRSNKRCQKRNKNCFRRSRIVYHAQSDRCFCRRTNTCGRFPLHG